MKMRQRKHTFTRDHVVVTFRVTSDYAEYLRALEDGSRLTYMSRALHKFLNGGKRTHSYHVSPKSHWH